MKKRPTDVRDTDANQEIFGFGLGILGKPHQRLAWYVLIIVAFLPSFTVKEIERVFGEEKIRGMFFRGHVEGVIDEAFGRSVQPANAEPGGKTP